MPRIKQSSIEAIRAQVNIVDVVSAHVQLKRVGNRWLGLSPFSSEKTPSFNVHPDKGFYYCFSTSQGGDLFDFVQKQENLSFYEAVEALSARFNIPLEYEAGEGGGANAGQRASRRKELFAIHEAAAAYFHECLLAEKAPADQVREYWTQRRRFDLEVAKKYAIGFAPPDGGRLVERLLRAEFTPAAIEESGLFYEPRGRDSNPRTLRPRFRGRLMIPIRDVQGRVIAFTARQLEGVTPEDDPPGKYINSPETPLFRKSHVLFGLERARTHVKDASAHFLLVEGQLDAIRCWEHGLATAVAPQGTAITAEQLALMARYTPQVRVFLDGDAAGRRAAVRALPLAFKAGLELRFIPLPEGADPDSLLLEKGSEAVEALRENSLSAMDVCVREWLPEPLAASPREKSEALGRIIEVLRECDSVLAAQANLSEAAALLRVEQHIAEQEWSRQQGKVSRGTVNENRPKTQGFSGGKLTTAASELLFLCIRHDHLVPFIAEVLDPDWLTEDSPEAALWLSALSLMRNNQWNGQESLANSMEESKPKQLLYRLLSLELQIEDPVDAANRCLRRLYTHALDNERRRVEGLIVNTPEVQPEQLASLYGERRRLRSLASEFPQISPSSDLIST
ncbi:MAG: DNA primase [Opitutales bacterium]